MRREAFFRRVQLLVVEVPRHFRCGLTIQRALEHGRLAFHRADVLQSGQHLWGTCTVTVSKCNTLTPALQPFMASHIYLHISKTRLIRAALPTANYKKNCITDYETAL